jgi:hypothetical protein
MDEVVDHSNHDGSPARNQALILQLPAADPTTYLAWMAYWRDVESKMLELPALEQFASSEAAPFLHGSTALQLSDAVRQITTQAVAAMEADRAHVAPDISLTGSPEMLTDMASHILRRGAWLAKHAVALRIEGPSIPVRQLRASVVKSLQKAARRLAPKESASGPSCKGTEGVKVHRATGRAIWVARGAHGAYVDLCEEHHELLRLQGFVGPLERFEAREAQRSSTVSSS